jgi:hypothetical protein
LEKSRKFIIYAKQTGHFFCDSHLSVFETKDTNMKKVYIFYVSFVLSIAISTIAIGQVTVFEDKFETYNAGQQISCQAPTIWKTWTANPCNSTEDAYVSNSYSFSGTNSLLINQNNDIVKEIGTPITTGIAEINFMLFVPTGKGGYFNTLASFDPPNYVWAMQVYLDSTGTGTLDAGGASAATFSYPNDQWFPVKVVADLTANIGEFWLNGVKIHSWQWTLGTFGSPLIALQLDGTDFFGNTANNEMYVDDYNITHTTYTTKVTSTPTGGNWNSGSTWVGNNVPNQNAVVEIVSGATVNLTANRTRNALTIVKGTLNCGTFNITGSGSFVISSDATLQIGSTSGISLSGTTGNIRVTGTRSFNQFANYIYNGSSAQVTGNGLPAAVKNLTINNAAGVTLSSNVSVSGMLNLVTGNLITNSNTLSLGTSVTNLGTLNIISGKLIGNFNRWLSNSTNILFPVGTSTTKYTPIELNNVIGSGSFTVNAIAGVHPNSPGPNVLQMYWKLTNAGLTSADLTFNYLDADVVGDENQYELGRYNGISWDIISPIILNTTNNTASIAGINSFSDWTLGEDGNLPVELTSFYASTIGLTVKLSWKTATEINNYGFDIERMSNVKSQTSNVWEKIGFVNGYGNSNSPKSYFFEDKSLLAGKYQYRLKQVDTDGQFTYSSILAVDLATPKEFSLEQNYPNPFNPITTIKFTIPETNHVKIKVFNLLGEEIVTLINEVKEAGSHTVQFDASSFNSGIYLYKIEATSTGGKTFVQTKKMTLIK